MTFLCFLSCSNYSSCAMLAVLFPLWPNDPQLTNCCLKYKWHVLKEDKVRWVSGWGDKVGVEEKMWILTLIELQETSMEWISLGSEKSPTGKRLICSFLSNLKQPNIIFVTYLDSVLMKGSFFDNITVGKLRFWSKFGNRYIWIYAFWYLSRTIFQNKF